MKISLELKVKLIALTILCGIFYFSAQNGKVIAKENTLTTKVR